MRSGLGSISGLELLKKGMKLRITAITSQIIREPRASEEAEDEVIAMREISAEGHRASAVSDHVELYQQNEPGDFGEPSHSKTYQNRRDGSQRRGHEQAGKEANEEGPEAVEKSDSKADVKFEVHGHDQIRDQISGLLPVRARDKHDLLRQAVAEVEAFETERRERELDARFSLPESLSKGLTKSQASAIADPIAEVLRRLAFQTTAAARKKERACARYARVKAETDNVTFSMGFHVNRAA